MADRVDVLVLGGGPAALCIASELHQCGLAVEGIAPEAVDAPWPNTYGIWADELKAVGLEHLLEHRWRDTVSYFGAGGASPQDQPIAHGIDYGLFDRAALQQHWLQRSAGVVWHRDVAERVEAGTENNTAVICASGEVHRARLVIDASGARSPHIQRSDQGPVAGQAAYGLVARFSSDPINSGRFVLMDYRCDHLTEQQRLDPPTFLYAMDLGDGVFFVEETSLAHAPGIPYDVLRQRLQQRLQRRGVEVIEVLHEEFCLFPMNLPLPDFSQPLLAFGGAASMVHPASGYMVGALLRRGPGLAAALARAMADQSLGSAALARHGWQALWPMELVLRHRLYQFGLGRLMGFNERLLRHHFATFFSLPQEDWFGFLTNTLPLPRLMGVMLRLFTLSSWELRRGLVLGMPAAKP